MVEDDVIAQLETDKVRLVHRLRPLLRAVWFGESAASMWASPGACWMALCNMAQPDPNMRLRLQTGA